jgi:hypothetical protein
MLRNWFWCSDSESIPKRAKVRFFCFHAETDLRQSRCRAHIGGTLSRAAEETASAWKRDSETANGNACDLRPAHGAGEGSVCQTPGGTPQSR